MILKKKLKDNKLTIGSWLTINHISVVEIMATAGFEWLTIDLEHTAIDIQSAQLLILAIQSKGMKALVRVSKNEEVIIKRVLDAGADGIIVPKVNSLACAKKAVSYAKYPPIGERGVGLSRAQGYGTGFDKYCEKQAEEIIIIAQIEHIDGVNNFAEIAQCAGIDGCLIGPYDLSASMGIPGQYQKEEVKVAINEVLEIARKYNFPSGFHVIESDPKFLKEKIDQGCTFLAYSIDFLFLGDSARLGMEKIQAHCASAVVI